MKPPSPELRALIDRVLEEEPLAKSEVARLEELLKDKQALHYYTRIVSQESLLAEALSGIEETIGEAPKPPVLPLVRVLAAAAAACVIFALGFFSGRGIRPPAAPPAAGSPHVQVTGLMGVEWEPEAGPEILSGAAVADRIAFRSGLVELTYASGVRVTLEGPAEFSVTDAAAGNLAKGKLVAYVPPGAEGFTVDYAGGKVVDLGTEFAMEIRGSKTEVGVFDGEIELHLAGDKPRSLFQDQAVIHDEQEGGRLRAVPLDREKFVRRMPARDFRWEMTSHGPQEVEFDVSHLIWKPSAYRAIFKWIEGPDAIVVQQVELRRDGAPVTGDFHEGVTGSLRLVRDNLFHLEVRPEDFGRGRWTLHVKMKTYPREDSMADYTGSVASQGILQFEEGLVSTATAEEFIGRWSYHHLGTHYVREFHADGRVSLFGNGRFFEEGFKGCRWEVADGVLKVDVPGGNGIYERHVLRDRTTLIFVSNPYGNATRVEPP